MAIKILSGVQVTGVSNLTAADIPTLDASKIASGTLSTSRIPNLDASKITSGTLNAARVPDLSATYAPATHNHDGLYYTQAVLNGLLAAKADAAGNATQTWVQSQGYITSVQTPAITSNGATPSLNTGITAAEIRSLIGAGTSSFSGAYSSLTGIPTSFTPSAHGHPIADIQNLETTLSNLQLAVDGKQPAGSYLTSIPAEYLTETEGNALYQPLGSYAAASHTHTFASLTSKPTTLSGYGITDAAASNHTHTFASITSKPTTLSGYGITDAASSSHNHDSSYAKIQNSQYYVEAGGTTGYFTADIPEVTSLYDGLTILMYAAQAFTSYNYMNLNGFGDKLIYLYGSSRLTTHYPRYSVIPLVYHSTANGGCWYTDMYYDSTDDYRIRWQNNITFGAYTHGYQILLEGADGKFYPVTEGGSTGNTNTVSTAELKLGGTILYYGNSTDRAAGYEGGGYDLYSGIYNGEMEYWNNVDAGWAVPYRSFYFVGTVNEQGNFVLDNSTYTSFLTQDLPTSEDGKVYVQVGIMNNNYDAYRLNVDHPIYEFKDGKLRNYIATHTHQISEINGLQSALDGKQPVGSYAAASHTHTFASLTSKPTTLSGYGITDAATSGQGAKADSAYGWGDHSQAGYITQVQGDTLYQPIGNYAAVAHSHAIGDVTGLQAALDGKAASSHSHTFASITSKPTTLSGYGITDAATSAQGTKADTAYGWGNHASAGYATTTYVNTAVNNLVAAAPAALDTLNELAAALGDDPNFATTMTNALAGKASTSHTHTFASLTSKPTTLSGYGITDAASSSHTHTFASLTSKPTTLSGYGITDAASASHNHDSSYIPMSYGDVDMENYDKDKNLLMGRNIGGWPTGVTKPAGTHNGFGIFQVTTHGGGYATQLGLDTNQNALWIRSANPTTWGAWKRLWDTDNLTTSSISNWNTAYGWGNHASAGYLTAVPAEYLTQAEADSMYQPVGNYQPAGTYNTIIGTDADIATSGATIVGSLTMTDGVITAHSTRTLTPANIGAAAASHTHSVSEISFNSTVLPTANGIDLGNEATPFNRVVAHELLTAGFHEANLRTEGIGENPTGTVCIWEGGKLVPCTKENSHMVMGVIKHKNHNPIVMGAEPVLVTGEVNEGDFLISSDVEGHAIAIPEEVFTSMHYSFARALQSGSGDSHTILAFIKI